MNKLVAGECGGSNPLMNLKNKVKVGNSYQNELVGIGQRQQGYGVVQQSFDMQTLLDQVEDIQPQAIHPINQFNNDVSLSWQQELMKQNHEQIKLQKDVKLKTNTGDQQFQQFQGFQPSMQFPPYVNSRFMQHHFNCYQHPYLGDSQRSQHMVKTGYEILQSMEDKVLDDDQLEELNKKISKKESGTVEQDKSAEWAEEYQKEEDAFEKDVLTPQNLTEGDLEYWDKLQNDWNDLFSQEQFMNDEELALGDFKPKEEYHFEDANPFVNTTEAFEKGLKKLKEGDLISAILLFEEAVRVNPDHAEAWQYLGTSQAENEQENLAIAALKKCVELQPDNLTSRMSLAVSYTNESLQVQACNSLKAWIEHNPRYSHLLPSTIIPASQPVSSFMSQGLFKEIESLFLAAARIAPQGDIDADIQVALGVLFNLSGDYEKAIDCLQSGLHSRPDSADIWNKLGATLANSGKSGEAVEAYRNALHLRPGYIRCRYNLGISCINMKAYTEAAEHFLTALNMQRQGEDPSRTASTMSENIWSTLRMTLSMLGRLDLMKTVDKRDLKSLNNEFKISDTS